jgi:outer membrane protein assembly factor BamE
MQKNLIFVGLLGLFLSTSGCSYFLPEPHKIDIQQGNRVTPEDLAKIQLGMTQDQVRFVLGTPLLQDAFHRNRWDYVYYLKPGGGDVRQSRVSLYFEGDALVKIDTSEYRPEQQERPKEED